MNDVELAALTALVESETVSLRENLFQYEKLMSDPRTYARVALENELVRRGIQIRDAQIDTVIA